MPIISIFIALILGVLALAFVLQPLYRHRPMRADKSAVGAMNRPLRAGSVARQTPVDEEMALISNSKRASLENEQSARAAIQEVELDYQLGNITEADYTALRERYLRRALVAMKSRYDHHDRDQQLDDDIEARLRQMREQHDRNE
ncbi:MAG TPA: hypothetical protein VEV19_14375 [Ktedonobacteraceae bacterium]|nr:hypothetical protein [Ktedonobacteraceae bacterium]